MTGYAFHGAQNVVDGQGTVQKSNAVQTPATPSAQVKFSALVQGQDLVPVHGRWVYILAVFHNSAW